MSSETISLDWGLIDESGRPSALKLQTDKDATFATLQTIAAALDDKLAAITASGVRKLQFTKELTIAQTSAVTTDQTGTAMDKIQWILRDTQGNPVKFQTPSPLPAQMLPDGITVDLTNVAIAAFVADIFAYCESPYGFPIIAVTKAYRWFRNRKAKNV